MWLSRAFLLILHIRVDLIHRALAAEIHSPEENFSPSRGEALTFQLFPDENVVILKARCISNTGLVDLLQLLVALSPQDQTVIGALMVKGSHIQ